MTECTFCHREAIYRRPYSGEALCGKCYVESVASRVQRTITRHRMFKPDDRIGVALSGGKDSAALLHILAKLEERFPRSELVAITIDEGIDGYRGEAAQIARETCAKLGVEHFVYSFKEFYGYDLDEIVRAAKERGKLTPCSHCGILRRKALNVAAREVGATRLATAHNLDDEAQSVLMNLLRGGVLHMYRSAPPGGGEADLVQRVKPLRQIPEREVALYAFLKKIRFQTAPCPYGETSLRSDIRRFLNDMESKHPGMKFTVLRSFEKMRPRPDELEARGELGRCRICSEPTSGEVCRACQALRELGLEKIGRA